MKRYGVFAAVLILVSCATNPDKQLDKDLLALDVENYLQYDGKKSYALALDEDGSWSSGFAWGKVNQDLADKTAMLECNARKKKDNRSNECVIYMRGDEKQLSLAE